MVTLARLTIALALSLVLAACSGTQEKASSGDVEVKLRRVDLDLEKASFDTVDLLIVAIVENGTSSDVQVAGGEGQLMLAGRAKVLDDGQAASASEDDAADDESAPEEDEAAEEEEEEEEAEDEESEDAERAVDSEMDDEVDTSGIVTGDWVNGTAPSGKAVAFQTTEVPIRVTLKLPDDSDALERLTSWGRMAVEVKGTLQVNGKTHTFGGVREVATPVLPKPVLEEAQVASVDEGEKGVAFFRVGIDNPNVFDIKVDSFAWGVTVGGKELRPVPEGSWENVPASSVASFEDSINLDTETYGPEVKKLLRQPTVPYVIEGRMVVKGIEKEFRFEGDMEFAR